MYARIIGTGSYLPERVVHNTDLEKIMDTSDEWIRERTGIERRHYAAEGETTVDMGEHAARRAIAAAGLTPGDIDLIVFGTTTPDLVFPECRRAAAGAAGLRWAGRPSASRPPAAASSTRCRSPRNSSDWASRSGRWSLAPRRLPASPISPIAPPRCCLPMAPAPWCSAPSEAAGHHLHPPARRWQLPEPAVLHRRHFEGLRARHQTTAP